MPVDKVSSERNRQQSFWTGDVWKIVLILKRYRPDLSLFNLDGCLTGLLCVTNLDPNSTVLQDNYQKIIDEYLNINFDDIKQNEKERLFAMKEEDLFYYITNIRNF